MNRIISIPIDNGLGSFIGKKGNETSMTFYNRKTGSDIIVGIAPSDIPGKFYALPNSLILGEQIVINTEKVDALFGEVVIASSLLGKRIIFTKDNDIASMISALNIKDVAFSDKEGLLDSISSFVPQGKAGKVKVEIDRSFNVKGVGTVLLGIVTNGILKKHDILYNAENKPITVRSIQCQDDEVEQADLGARVGIAAKGIDEKDVDRGAVLSTERIQSVTRLNLEVNSSKVASEEIKNGNQYGIFSGFGSGSCMVESTDEKSITIKLDKGFQLQKGDTLLLSRNKQPRIFASALVL